MRTIARIVSAAVLALGATTSAWSAPLYSGSLCTPDVAGCDGELVGNSNWADNIKLTWEVSFDNGLWTYEYHFEDLDPDSGQGGAQGLSHLIIEVSDNFGEDDLKEGSSTDDGGPTEYDGTEPSNPGLPGTIFGVKFNTDDQPGNPDGTDLIITIVTERAPVWGDFYAKDGKFEQEDNWVYNKGFTNADPGNDPSNGSIDDHILRPDTKKGPPTEVAEPASLLLLASGLMGLGLWTRQKRKE